MALMKIIFTTLKTVSPTIKVSFNHGQSWNTYNVNDVKENGITFTDEDCPDLSKILIQGQVTSINDIHVQKEISIEDTFVPAPSPSYVSPTPSIVEPDSEPESDTPSITYLDEEITEIQEDNVFMENGTYTADTNKAYKTVTVNVTPNLENNVNKTIDVFNYTEPIEILPDSFKDGMKKATVILQNIPRTLYCWKSTTTNSYLLSFFNVSTECTFAFQTTGKKQTLEWRPCDFRGENIIALKPETMQPYTAIPEEYSRDPTGDITLY